MGFDRFRCIAVLALVALTGPPFSEVIAQTGGSVSDSADAACEQEVVDLHRFFEQWMTGRLDDTDAAFAAFRDAMADDFVIVSPDGQATASDPLVEALRATHGRYPPGGFEIRIENCRARGIADGVMLVTYEEWQQSEGEDADGRISSALLRRDDAGPRGWVWLHVHETGLR